MAILPTPVRTPGRWWQEPPRWPESCFPREAQATGAGGRVDAAPAPGPGRTGAPRAGTPGEGRARGLCAGRGRPPRALAPPEGVPPSAGAGGSANTASGLGGGPSRVPKTVSCPSGFAKAAGVKAKSREHVRAEGHPEEGKQDPMAPAPYPARAEACGHGQHRGAACRDPCSQSPGPHSGHQKESSCWYFSGAEKQLK